jgi:hypothetical protein
MIPESARATQAVQRTPLFGTSNETLRFLTHGAICLAGAANALVAKTLDKQADGTDAAKSP